MKSSGHCLVIASLGAGLLALGMLSGCQPAPSANDNSLPLSAQLHQAADRFLLKAEQLRVEKADLGTRLKSELSAGQYAGAETILTTLDRDDRADPRYEFVYRDALDAISSCDAPDESMERPLLGMEDVQPKSAWPHLLLGQYYESMACHARGTGWARDVNQDQWNAMGNFDRRAYSEYQEALAINPDLFPVYDGLLDIANGLGDLQQITAIYQQSRQHLPDSYLLAADYMNALEPRWHGAYGLMQQFAALMRKQVQSNPRFYDLGGYVFADRADWAYRNKDYAAALHLYYQALEYGDYPTWLKWAAESADGARAYPAAWVYYQRYLAYKPRDAEARKRWHEFDAFCRTPLTPACRSDRGFPWGNEMLPDPGTRP